MKTVASYLNLFPPVSKCNYNGINKQIYDALAEKAIESCQGAATETKGHWTAMLMVTFKIFKCL